MTDRVRFSRELRCDRCGATGEAIYEEDDARADNRHTELIEVRGPWRHANGKFSCEGCAHA
jgi:hypothetical protein